MSAITLPSFMESARERDDAMHSPFRIFERAHHRKVKVLEELAAVNDEIASALEGMKAVGYVVRDVAPGDELQEVAPIPPEQFRAEVAA